MKENYTRYIYQVLKIVHPDIGISGRAMTIINSLINELFKRVAAKASVVARYGKKTTLTSWEIHIATQLLLPAKMAKHASFGGTKAVMNYTRNI